MSIPHFFITVCPPIFVSELSDDERLCEHSAVILMVLSYILLVLICEPLRAWLIGGSNGNVDLNELLRGLAL